MISVFQGLIISWEGIYPKHTQADTSQTHCDLVRSREDEIQGLKNLSGFTGLENQSLGQPGEMDNEVLIGKAKTGFPWKGHCNEVGQEAFCN